MARRQRGDAARAAQPRARPPRIRRASQRCAPGRGKGSSGSRTWSTASRSRSTTSAAETRRRSVAVVFTVGGFRADGARVERAAGAIVTEERRRPHPALSRGRGAVTRSAFEQALWNRVEAHAAIPRRDGARPGSARRGTIRRSSGEPPHLATSGRARASPCSTTTGTATRTSSSATACARCSTRTTGTGASRTSPRRPASRSPRREGIPATGVAAGDVDGDGYPDLFVTNAFGPARLFHNRGDGTFEETTAASGIAVPENMRSAAFADVDGDGDLDLFVGVTGDYYTQMPDPAFDANDGRQNFLYLNDGHGRFTDATKAWGLAGHDALDALDALPGLRPGRPRRPAGDQRLRAEEPLPQRKRQALRRRREEGRRPGARVRHVGRVGRLRRRRPARPLHDRNRHAVVLPPRVPGDPRRPRRAAVPALRDPVVRGHGLGQHAAAPAPRPHVRGRDGALGRAAGRLELELRRRRPRRRRLARHLRHQRHVGRRPRPRRRARVLVADARVLGRLRRRHEDVRPQGRGHRRHRARPVLSQPRRRGRGTPLFEERAFLDGLDLETNGRAVVAFDANGDGALDLYIRSVGGPGGPLPRVPEARTSTTCASAWRGLPERTTATASARASRRRSRAAARS